MENFETVRDYDLTDPETEDSDASTDSIHESIPMTQKVSNIKNTVKDSREIKKPKTLYALKQGSQVFKKKTHEPLLSFEERLK